jgi:hypothetical protein
VGLVEGLLDVRQFAALGFLERHLGAGGRGGVIDRFGNDLNTFLVALLCGRAVTCRAARADLVRVVGAM